MGNSCGFSHGGCVGNSVCTGLTNSYSTGTCTCPPGAEPVDGNTWCSGTVALGGDCTTVGNNYACTGMSYDLCICVSNFHHFKISISLGTRSIWIKTTFVALSSYGII